ncbi:MAG: protein translocase subunit SecD [Acidobacteria bacterium]|jgi:preprotein translocase subunit SecD|nr:MAG: protein translocase subunit SecD [Acidobacteriota bacterium]
MNKNLTWKVVIIVAAVLIFVYGIFGVPAGFSGDALANALISPSAMRHGINLGLDLKGGTHLILQVQVNDAVNFETDNAMESLKAAFKSAKITYSEITKPDPNNHPEQIVIKGVAPESRSQLQEAVQAKLADYDASPGTENNWTVTLRPQPLQQLKDGAVDQAIETIRSRIDELGVNEPVIERHGLGQYQILVQLPGVDDPARVKEIMQSTAMLEIKLVLGGPYGSEQEARQAHQNDDSLVLQGSAANRSSSDSGEEWYAVTRTSVVTGRDMRQQGASPGRDEENGTPDVMFNLTNEGGRKFAQFTGAHIGDKLAVILNKKVREAATIQSQIHDQVRITGGFTEQSAKDLAFVLNSGALPAGITYLEERTVGPSLGADSIRAGVRAAIVGMVAVLVFMLIYYRAAGINADVALVLNLIILLGVLGFIGATLTLPGIAGVILTVGMGVDSNVLIFERIREELRNGKTPPSAVEQGFGHAWITIVDTHVTTIVSAAILLIFGTGPVKGFATTLIIGLFANLFTAVFVSRVIFDWVLSRKAVGEALSI